MKLPWQKDDDAELHSKIREHYDRFWGPDRIEEVHWTPGPTASRLPGLHIAKVTPVPAADPWALATIGMSSVDSEHNHGIEVVTFAPSAGAAVMTNLAMLAFYHAGPVENRLGLGHTVPIGTGWTEGSPLDHVLLTAPYPWGAQLEVCDLGGRVIQVLWALPVHGSEVAFKAAEGLEELERRFEAAAIDAMDPQREPVV